MIQPIRLLLQTTLPAGTQDDWTIESFSLLQNYLASLIDEQGNSLCQVTARDRHANAQGHDPVLSQLTREQFDELWLFALDVGDGLSEEDCAGIRRFHQQGGGILTTRDHQDMGLSMSSLPHIGSFHYFHTRQCDPDLSRCQRDDVHTPSINWPNYHSGRNGDYQLIVPVEPLHPLLKNSDSATGAIAYFPAHPHEGGIGVPQTSRHARVIATGTSQVSQRKFNLVVAAERIEDEVGHRLGRVVAQSTFHHFVDYNWDLKQGCPSFVDELPGEGMAQSPQALKDIQAYVRNLAFWLAPDEVSENI